MESRKIVPMNLFAGKQWRNRHREQTYGRRRGWEGEGEMYGESNTETYITVSKRRPTGICYLTQGTQTGALLTT